MGDLSHRWVTVPAGHGLAATMVSCRTNVATNREIALDVDDDIIFMLENFERLQNIRPLGQFAAGLY